MAEIVGAGKNRKISVKEALAISTMPLSREDYSLRNI
jgi:hypothetical protein